MSKTVLAKQLPSIAKFCYINKTNSGFRTQNFVQKLIFLAKEYENLYIPLYLSTSQVRYG
ncbi:hypothetical protein LguiB_027602 [Lonicera macranthoides]